MDLHSLLMRLLIYGFYPAWLLAGLLDYLCHRRSHIEATSGEAESNFHIAQFFVLALCLTLATALKITSLTLLAMVLLVVAHTALAYMDVLYTEELRYISPFEQTIHGVMDVLPIVTVSMLAILNWQTLHSQDWSLQRNDVPLLQVIGLAGSYCVLSGPVLLEEWLRTSRHVAKHEYLLARKA